jgi:hypothetical protein
MKSKSKKVKSQSPKSARAELRGRRFTAEQKHHALVLVASGMAREQVAATVGTTRESLRRWVKEAKATGTLPTVPVAKVSVKAARTSLGACVVAAPEASDARAPRSPYAPADPAQGLGEHEVAAILELKRAHPSMGPAQLRAQLKRFKGWRLSLKAIARVLRGHGYEPVHRGGRP